MDLTEVRKNIDRVDRQIRELFVQRMELANQVVEIKARNGDEIYKPEREQVVIQKQTEGMESRWVKPYTALLKKIMGVSREYQYGRMLELREHAPFTWSEQKKEVRHLAVAHSEEEYARAVASVCTGQADAGQAIWKKDGIGISAPLEELLLENHLFITEYMVGKETGVENRVTFADHLEVLPQHDHIRITFMISEPGGSLSVILSTITDYGVGITEIYPRPAKEQGQFRFFVEIHCHLDTGEGQALLYQIMKETREFKILGSYRKEGEEDVCRGKEF